MQTDGTDVRDVFATIHRDSLRCWGSAESVSGYGSELRTTLLTRAYLHRAFRLLGIRTLVDAPCGDGTWISELADGLERYWGFDIVPEVVREAADRHTRPNRSFAVGDIIADRLPAADAVLCRDCMIHLPFAAIRTALATLAAGGSTYLIATSWTHRPNVDCGFGDFRPINLQAEPFCLPAPLLKIPDPGVRDRRIDKATLDKVLGVWRMADVAAAEAR